MGDGDAPATVAANRRERSTSKGSEKRDGNEWYFISFNNGKTTCSGIEPWPSSSFFLGAWRVCGMRVRLKPDIKLFGSAVGSHLDILLAIDFNGDKILYVFFWVHNG